MISKFIYFLGYLWSFFYSYKHKIQIVPILRRLHTGWIKRYVGHIGVESLIEEGIQICGGKNIRIGDFSCIDKKCALTCISDGGKQGRISIGDHVSIGPYAHITSLESITIGNNIDIGPHCLISDNSKKATTETVHINPRKRPLTTKGPIKIGDYTWIGENVCIMSGVTIGVGCVIGANSVVTHNIPDYSVAAGIPAKIISKIE